MIKLVLLLLATSSFSQTLVEALVIRVSDGDTITVASEEGELTIRLRGIDAPETKQRYGYEATEALKGLIDNSYVLLVIYDQDQYKRYIAEVLVDDISVNQTLVYWGLAWHYRQFSEDEILQELEDEARYNRRGLWQDQNPIPPWEFRRR